MRLINKSKSKQLVKATETRVTHRESGTLTAELPPNYSDKLSTSGDDSDNNCS